MNPDSLSSSGFGEFYASIGAGIDVSANAATVGKAGVACPCRQITVFNGGTIVVKFAGSVANSATMTVGDNAVITGQITNIVSGTATNILVLW